MANIPGRQASPGFLNLLKRPVVWLVGIFVGAGGLTVLGKVAYEFYLIFQPVYYNVWTICNIPNVLTTMVTVHNTSFWAVTEGLLLEVPVLSPRGEKSIFIEARMKNPLCKTASQPTTADIYVKPSQDLVFDTNMRSNKYVALVAEMEKGTRFRTDDCVYITITATKEGTGSVDRNSVGVYHLNSRYPLNPGVFPRPQTLMLKIMAILLATAAALIVLLVVSATKAQLRARREIRKLRADQAQDHIWTP